MRILHLYSCFCPSDMNRFYNSMSSLGYDLEKSNYFSDCFYKKAKSRNSYFVIPKAYYKSLDDFSPPDTWEYLTENKNYFIFIKKDVSSSQTPTMPKFTKNTGPASLLGILLLPICLYYIAKDLAGTYNMDRFFFTVSGIAVFTWFGFAWSAFMEAVEMNFYLQHGALLPYNKIRYNVSAAMLILSNLIYAVFILLILCRVFLRP